MADTEVVSRAVNKLPAWAQGILAVIAIAVSVYYIAHYGFFSFLVRLIFSPDF